MELKNNGLLIADIHLKKDERFAPEGTINYRLEKQPMMLLDRIEELIKEHNVGWVGILGDLLDIPNCLPQELRVLDTFLGRMNEWGIPILVILGQHDIDTNKYDDGGIDYYIRSNVTVLIEHYNNITYAHNTYGTINGKYSCYLSNYSDPLIYPDKYVDLWLTHCSLGFTHVEEWNTDEKNVKFDRKFGMMVAGDIHEHYQFGNCFTVGTPYQHKAHEQQTGVIGLIKDTGEKLEFSRILSDTAERKFLRFEPPVKKVAIKNEKGEDVSLDITQKTVMEQIESKIVEMGLEHIHNKISKTGAPNPVNFNFKIKKLKIENYKSCKEYELDFTTFKKTLFLQGKYGSGKSTIVEAIRDVFCGDTKTIDSKVSYWAKNCRLQIDIEYENKEFTIVRGKSLLEFYINGEQQTASNMKGLESLITLALPFVKYLYLFLPQSNERLFDPEKGLELFQRCFNLDVFDYYLDSAVKLKKLFNEENNVLFSSMRVKEGERNVLQAEVDRLKNNIEESKAKTKGDYKKLTQEKDRLKQASDKLVGILATINELSPRLYQLMELTKDYPFIDRLKESLAKEQKTLAEMKKDDAKRQEKKLLEKELQNTREQYSLLSKSLKQVSNVPAEPVEQLEARNKELEEGMVLKTNELTLLKFKNKKTLEEELVSLQKGINKGNYTCPTCKQKVIKDVSDLKEQKNTVEAELKKCIQQIEASEKDLASLKKEKQEIDSKLKTIEAVKDNNKINKQLEEIVEKGKQIKNNLDSIQILYAEEDLLKQQSNIETTKEQIKMVEEYNALKERVFNLRREEDSITEQFGYIQPKLTEIDKQISYHTIYMNYERELETKQSQLDSCVDEIAEMSIAYEKGVKHLSDWDTYMALMDYSNLESIPYKLINLLISNFNTDSFRISASRTQKNGKEKFAVDLLIRDENSKYWTPYVSQSGGQKLLSDLYLYDSVAKFMGGVGILSLDENLNTASTDLYPLLNDIISGISFNNLILVSHSQQISSFDKKITVYLNDNHESCYS